MHIVQEVHLSKPPPKKVSFCIHARMTVLLPHNVLYFRESSVKLTYILSLEKCKGLFIKGLKHNLQSKPGNWINNLALEAESAVYYLSVQ